MKDCFAKLIFLIFFSIHLSCSYRSYRPLGDLDFSKGKECWHQVKEYFLLEKDLHYFNTGSLGAMPKALLERLQKRLSQIAKDPERCWKMYDLLEPLRSKLAKFLGVLPDEIAFVRNATEAMNIIANGIRLKPGDEVIITDQEHPAGYSCWQRKVKRCGIKLIKVVLPIPANSAQEILRLFEERISPRTRIISISHITYATGVVLPVRRLCRLAHEKGILVVIDGAQAVGMLNLNLKDLGCDFYAASTHKWLLAPAGTGFLYVRKRYIKDLKPNIISFCRDRKTARKFEDLGTRNIPGILAVADAIDLQNTIGRSRIQRRIRELAKYLKEGLSRIKGVKILSPQQKALSSGLTTFSIRRVDPEWFCGWLRENYKISVRAIYHGRVEGIRVSTHIYNTPEQIDVLLKAIREFLSKRI
jgi:selenocysteine lyase/cysteine desulfurase